MAGVSIATVSNVVNGNYRKVSEKKRQEIEKIIRDSGYKPNAIARSLAKNESRIIGLVVPYIGPDEDFTANPYHAQIIAALEKNVRNRDYYLMIRCVNLGREVIPLLSSWNVDGAFFLGVMEKEVREITRALDVPVVFVDTYTRDKSIVNIGIDDYRGGSLLAGYLTDKGHKKIALAIPDFQGKGVIRERYNGFCDALKEAGCDFNDEDIFRTDTLYKPAIDVAGDIVSSKRGYTAIATMSDIVALGIMEGLRQHGMTVPEDMSVMGFDNLPQTNLISPRLTTIAQDIAEKAGAASKAMFDMIMNKENMTMDLHLPVQVMEGESVRSLL